MTCRPIVPVALAIVSMSFVAHGQPVECVFEEQIGDQVYGACSGLSPVKSLITLQPAGSAAEGRWTGAITLGNYVELVELVPESEGSQEFVFRTILDWFRVHEWNPGKLPFRLEFNRSEVAAPTDDDVAILQEARRLLVATEDWDRSDDRNCSNDPEGSLSLYCSLLRASSSVMGRFYHRQPAMQRVRQAIDERWRDRVKGHRLMDFNNHPETTLEEVLEVLDRALELTRRDISQ